MDEQNEKVKYNQRLYNPGKAQKLVEIKRTKSSKYGENPDVDWTETLYRKPTGEFFVIGIGGKDTPFADYKDGMRVAGSQTTVWSQRNFEMADLWVYDHCPERHDEIINAKIEKPVIITFSLSERAKTNLKRKAKEQGTSASELIRQWAENFYVN